MRRSPWFQGLTLLLFLAGCSGAVENANLESGAKVGPEEEPDRPSHRERWTELPSVGAPEGREDHTAIWTGSKMIVWGGEIRGEGVMPLDTGARFDLETESWTSMSTVAAPDRRDDHAVVWTGTEMIVWGGNQADENTELLASGGRYDPRTDRWTAMSPGPLSPRDDPTAVWTGTEMIIWGGSTLGRLHEGSGARYNPSLDRWKMITQAGAPRAREDHTAVWTGEEMIVWGGWSGHDRARHHFNDGARYDPDSGRWTAISTKGAPAAREDHTAVWTGTEMLVWGGVVHRYDVEERTDEPVDDEDGSDGEAVSERRAVEAATDAPALRRPEERARKRAGKRARKRMKKSARKRARKRARKVQLASGALYNPVTDTWRPMTMKGAPKAREDHVAVWIGGELVVWGGRNGNEMLGDGARYDPTTDQWRPISNLAGEPSPRWNHTAVWAGDQVLVWGGFADGYDGDGASYVP